MKKPTIGFIGQGYIGSNYANDFEKRGFKVTRYSVDPKHIDNKEKIANCDIVFIAVPTPTTPKGFDGSVVESVLSLVGVGKIAVIKSTITVGMTKAFQKKYPKIVLLHSPEFLSEATASYDASHPFCNIVGVSKNDAIHNKSADEVLKILPKSPFSLVCSSEESEIIKYTHNCFAYSQIIFFNMMYDFAKNSGANWDIIQSAIFANPTITKRYSNPIHKSGRGAGGHCFIKDFSAFVGMYKKNVPKDKDGLSALKFFEKKNISLLVSTKKDLDLLRGVYGNAVIKRKK